jgi:hypothetical protein
MYRLQNRAGTNNQARHHGLTANLTGIRRRLRGGIAVGGMTTGLNGRNFWLRPMF